MIEDDNIRKLLAELATVTTERNQLQARLTATLEWREHPLPEDDAIAAAHPVNTGDHDTYEEARRLVSARHSKYGLIALVNWLLARLKATDTAESQRDYFKKALLSRSTIEEEQAVITERDRLKRGDFTPEEFQNLCHTFSEADQEAFCAGCSGYQKKLFGTSDRERLEGIVDHLRSLIGRIFDPKTGCVDFNRDGSIKGWSFHAGSVIHHHLIAETPDKHSKS